MNLECGAKFDLQNVNNVVLCEQQKGFAIDLLEQKKKTLLRIPARLLDWTQRYLLFGLLLDYELSLFFLLSSHLVCQAARKPASGNWGGENNRRGRLSVVPCISQLFFLAPVSARHLSQCLLRGSTNSRGKIGTAGGLTFTWEQSMQWPTPNCPTVIIVLRRVCSLFQRTELKDFQGTVETEFKGFQGLFPQKHWQAWSEVVFFDKAFTCGS